MIKWDVVAAYYAVWLAIMVYRHWISPKRQERRMCSITKWLMLPACVVLFAVGMVGNLIVRATK